jgi:hypothetical protein
MQSHRTAIDTVIMVPSGLCVLLISVVCQSYFGIASGLAMFVGGLVYQTNDKGRDRFIATEIAAMLAEANAEDVGLILKVRHDPYLQRAPRAEVNAALITALTRIGPDDSVALTPEQRAILRWMVVGSNIDLAVAILGAFEYIGNSGDCATVSRVVLGASPVQSDLVMERAKAVLPRMEARLRRARAGAGLLRASSAPDGHTLLRAHHGQDDNQSETLMRAVE